MNGVEMERNGTGKRKCRLVTATVTLFTVAPLLMTFLVFEGEPFFGQDRIEMAKWRMEQKGLTK